MIHKLNFLLAEDDWEDREMFEETFRKITPNGILHMVNDGKKVVDYLTLCEDDALPCGIILDYNMPYMNAPEVLDWLCGQKRMNGINKFVWSTANRPEYIDDCLGKGAIDYFVKPNNDEALLAIVQKIYDYCYTANETDQAVK